MLWSQKLGRVAIALAVIFNIAIAAWVMNYWLGNAGAVLAVLLFPITSVVLPVVMLFTPSEVAPAWAMWPAVLFMILIQKTLRPF